VFDCDFHGCEELSCISEVLPVEAKIVGLVCIIVRRLLTYLEGPLVQDCVRCESEECT
jgi:hypothetical protein